MDIPSSTLLTLHRRTTSFPALHSASRDASDQGPSSPCAFIQFVPHFTEKIKTKKTARQTPAGRIQIMVAGLGLIRLVICQFPGYSPIYSRVSRYHHRWHHSLSGIYFGFLYCTGYPFCNRLCMDTSSRCINYCRNQYKFHFSFIFHNCLPW